MKKIFLGIGCVVVLFLAVSVWRQLQPETQLVIVMSWSKLVRSVAGMIDQLLGTV